MIRVGSTSADLAAVEEVVVGPGQDALHGVAAGVARCGHSGLKHQWEKQEFICYHSKQKQHYAISKLKIIFFLKNQE